ncbi:MAG: hypothetical protein Q8O76_05290, partial [Chloroflexota bacterium]|nr:hypothetical protein [Chloroflexota bacterium]
RGEMVTRQDSVAELMRGAGNVMKWLGMLPGPMVKPAFRTGKLKVEVKVSREGMYLPKAEPGSLVRAGELLGRLISIEDLEVEEIRAPREGFLYMNGRYEHDGHSLNDLANAGETVAIIHEIMVPDDPNLEFSLHALCYGTLTES